MSGNETEAKGQWKYIQNIEHQKGKKPVETFIMTWLDESNDYIQWKEIQANKPQGKKVKKGIIISMAHLLLNIKPVKDGENIGG